MRKSLARVVTAVTTTSVSFALLATPAFADTEVPAPENHGPKNVIYMIGDGMGYQHVVNTNVYQSGQSRYQTQTNQDGTVQQVNGAAVQEFEETFDLVGLQTTPHGGTDYSPSEAWSNFDWANHGVTDSAAAGTAMATGVKTTNGTLGLHPTTGEHLTNMSEVAAETGRSAGVISSVQYNHATPAAFAVSNASRNNYLEIGKDMIDADYLDVVMGAGHPEWNDNGEQRSNPNYNHISKNDLDRLRHGQTDWDYGETVDDFEAWANGEDLPEKAFGLAQAATTLQQNRENSGTNEVAGDPFNTNVPDLPIMTAGALNVLDQNDEGFSLMIEGGAIDWTGHANQTVRNIEETEDFFNSVDTVIDWVNENSSWDETLVIVTADHETGYLWGDEEGFHPITGNAGETPNVGWYSGDHTNHLVPFFVRGAGAQDIMSTATMEDPVRGNYLDNVDPINTIFEAWEQTQQPAEGDIQIEAEVESFDPNGNGNAEDGALTLSVTPGTAQLENARNAGDRLRLHGTLPEIKVTDTRADAAGWAVSGQSSDLTTGRSTLTANYLGWQPFVMDSANGAAPGTEVTGKLRDGEGLAVPQTLGSADAETRFGSTSLAADLKLEVPVDTQEGTYQGGLSLSLFPVD